MEVFVTFTIILSSKISGKALDVLKIKGVKRFDETGYELVINLLRCLLRVGVNGVGG